MDFQWISECATQFTDVGADLFLMLLWEPLFAGWRSKSREELGMLYNSLQGSARWYRDLILVPRIREATPRGEILALSEPVTNSNFQVYRAFASRGLTDSEANLKAFVKMFARQGGQELPTSFVEKLQSYYEVSSAMLSFQFLSPLRHEQFWTRFHSRFCDRSEIPTLLPTNLARQFRAHRVEHYSKDVFNFLEKDLGKVDPQQLTRVSVRRAIQQRALQASQLEAALENGTYHSFASFDHVAALSALEIYLEMLMVALDELVGRLSPLRGIDSYRKADLFYDENVKNYFASCGVHSRPNKPSQAIEFALAELDFTERPAQISSALAKLIHAADAKSPSRSSRDAHYRHLWSLPFERVSPASGEFHEIAAGKRA